VEFDNSDTTVLHPSIFSRKCHWTVITNPKMDLQDAIKESATQQYFGK